eukprot:GHVL01032312.1.p1 GENE.GHVL01032312.1~~GHVL01032312.1.p1  ORF type:complete len:214 (+),score=9.06 GHVL01032312.1:53-694(+)
MKILLLLCALAALATCQRGSDFTAFLNEIPQHASFQRLAEPERLLFAELIMAAEISKDELKVFIDREGILKVIQLVDHLSDADAHKFAEYLAQHMGYHTDSHEWHHLQGWLGGRPHGGHGNKRDSEPDRDQHWNNLYGIMHDLQRDGYFHHLPDHDRHTLEGLMKAVNDRAVQQYIDSVGYGAIFGLLNDINTEHAHEIYTFLELGLAMPPRP